MGDMVEMYEKSDAYHNNRFYIFIINKATSCKSCTKAPSTKSSFDKSKTNF